MKSIIMLKTLIIQNKIRNNTASLEEMKKYKFQKYFFIENLLNYPTLNYNVICINLFNKYEAEQILYSHSQFSKYKHNY